MKRDDLRAPLLAHALETYAVSADYPFDDASVAILRHPLSRKWFAAIMEVKGTRLGLPDPDICTIVNVKCSDETLATLLGSEGFYPAYHMCKRHWMTVLLDGSVPFDILASLLEESYRLVTPRMKKRKGTPDTE